MKGLGVCDNAMLLLRRKVPVGGVPVGGVPVGGRWAFGTHPNMTLTRSLGEWNKMRR